MEFHQLLCELLRRFTEALACLKDAWGKPKTPAVGSQKFKEHLKVVLFFGCSLQQLIKGAAIWKHLRAIAPLLADHRRVEKASKNLMGEQEKPADEDVELHSVQPKHP